MADVGKGSAGAGGGKGPGKGGGKDDKGKGRDKPAALPYTDAEKTSLFTQVLQQFIQQLPQPGNAATVTLLMEVLQRFIQQNPNHVRVALSKVSLPGRNPKAIDKFWPRQKEKILAYSEAPIASRKRKRKTQSKGQAKGQSKAATESEEDEEYEDEQAILDVNKKPFEKDNRRDGEGSGGAGSAGIGAH